MKLRRRADVRGAMEFACAFGAPVAAASDFVVLCDGSLKS
jgi:hypothetical protein